VAVASNGDIYISEGHGETNVNNSRIMVFTKDGKFIKAFGARGTGNGAITLAACAGLRQPGLPLRCRPRQQPRRRLRKDGTFLTAGKHSAGRAGSPSRGQHLYRYV
jgi:hypothetical protein